jgi:hypothetical protein
VPDHGRQHEPERGVDRWDLDRRRGGEAGLAVVGDDDRRRLVGPVDRHLLGDVVGVEPVSPAAQTRISGSDDRSMCFLSSVASQAIDL